MASRLPRLQRSTNTRFREPSDPVTRLDETLTFGHLAREADFSMLGAGGSTSVQHWLADDSFVGDGAETAVAEGQEGAHNHDECPSSPLSNVEDDIILERYRQEPSCDVTTMMQQLRRQKSLDLQARSRAEVAPFATSTPHPSRSQVGPPASPIATRRPEPSASRARAVSQPGQRAAVQDYAATLAEISSLSYNLSNPSQTPDLRTDDMFERKKRDANRKSGILFEPLSLKSPGLPPLEGSSGQAEARPTVRLPSRARKSGGCASSAATGVSPTPRIQVDSPADACNTTVEPIASTSMSHTELAVQEPEKLITQAIAPSLTASLPLLTVPREFTFRPRQAERDGPSAREKSATRVAEQAAARTHRSISSAFAGPVYKVRPPRDIEVENVLPRPASALGHGRPVLAASTNMRVSSAPAQLPKPGRSSLAQSQPARCTTVATPFAFASEERVTRPRQTEAAPRTLADGKKRKRAAEHGTKQTTTETREFAFHMDKRRREA